MNDPNHAPAITYILSNLIVLYIFYLVFKKVFKIIGFDFDRPKYPDYYPRESLLSNLIQNMFKALLTGPFKFLGFLFNFEFDDNPKKAFMSGYEKRQFFKASNKGLLLDGDSARISDKVSFEHLAIIGRTGSGKSSKIVIPNIFTLDKASIVVTDLSGELFEKTSGYMKKKGFKIQVLNFSDIDNSLKYNPLHYATSSEKIAELAHIIIKSANPNPSSRDIYWNTKAEQIISILMSCLISTGYQPYMNLANVRYLLNRLGTDATDVEDFIARYATNEVLNDYLGFRNSGSSDMVGSVISTALASLNAVANNNIAQLTLENSIDFDELREKKTIFYLIVPQERMEFYSFLINIFYTQLFHSLMKDRNPRKLPVYLLLDEFGHLSIPNFSTIITTIRKYRVSISIFLQSIKQLSINYGQAGADTILNGGISSKLFLSGADNATTQELEKMLGKYRKKYKEDSRTVYRDEPVMSAEQIRTMPDNQALYIYANKKPAILDMKPYFKNFKFKRYAKRPPVNFGGHGSSRIEYVRL